MPGIGKDFLVPVPFSDDELIRTEIGLPPDATPEEGGTLKYLETWGLGPMHRLEFSPAEGSSVVTGGQRFG